MRIWTWLSFASVGGLAIGLHGCATNDCTVDARCGATGNGDSGGTPDGTTADVVSAGDGGTGDEGDASSTDASVAESGATGDSSDAEADAFDGFDGFVCDPTKSPHDESCVIDDAYGVFVSPGGSDVSGTGTKESPYATLGYALTHLAGKARLYICDATYGGPVSVTSAIGVYGGLACPNGDAGVAWQYVDGGGAQVLGPVNQAALTINGVAGAVEIEDMAFTAPNASVHDGAGNGVSSIAALVNGSPVTFRRCTFTAGNGVDGIDGGTGTNYANATAPSGQPPDDAGVGGAGGVTACGDGTSSTGGQGGEGMKPGGGNGAGGGSSPLPVLAAGQDGMGGAGGMFSCGAGAHPGANGAAGNAGVATPSGDYGSLTASGWTPSSGGAGTNGSPGQGGGGGGGLGTPLLGGTGGGAGGCGGVGGMGGAGGGASIALACISSNVTLDTCSLTTGNGGHGGGAGDGQPGQGGGIYGSAVGPCLGGYGGNGAGGSGGAGGTGGISVCVVSKGTPPLGTSSCNAGAAGQPGLHGAGQPGGTNALGTGTAGPDGADGLAGFSDAGLQVP